MNRVILLTGSGGFIGRAVLRCAEAFKDLIIMPLARGSAAEKISDARHTFPDAQISLMNLAWPSLQKYSAALVENKVDDQEWRSYKEWLSSLVAAAAREEVRFFQIGSGIEPFALSGPPSVSEPYLGYARRKNDVWSMVKASLPESSWRLRLHFLFGVGESGNRFVPSAIRASHAGVPMVLGSPERRRCWIDVNDAANGLLMAVLQAEPENWDICGVEPVSFGDLLSLIGEVTGCGVDSSSSERIVADADCLVARPTNVAPFMSGNVGNLDDLRIRLSEYAQLLRRE